jgi:hypothetical protein
MNDWEASRSPLYAIWVAFTWRAVTAGLATTLAFIVVKRELLNIGATAPGWGSTALCRPSGDRIHNFMCPDAM